MHEIILWSEELRAAYLYRVVAEAEAETATPRQKNFLDLATEAESQAAIWADKVRVAGVDAGCARTCRCPVCARSYFVAVHRS